MASGECVSGIGRRETSFSLCRVEECMVSSVLSLVHDSDAAGYIRSGDYRMRDRDMLTVAVCVR